MLPHQRHRTPWSFIVYKCTWKARLCDAEQWASTSTDYPVEDPRISSKTAVYGSCRAPLQIPHVMLPRYTTALLFPYHRHNSRKCPIRSVGIVDRPPHTDEDRLHTAPKPMVAHSAVRPSQQRESECLGREASTSAHRDVLLPHATLLILSDLSGD